jgi:hypothetical protein
VLVANGDQDKMVPAATRLILRTAFRMPSSYSTTTLDTGAFSSITNSL